MSSFYLRFKESTIHYTKFGNGNKWLFCLHGYGEQAETFGFLKPLIAEHYTVIAIDAPFHGKTEWKQRNEAFTPAMLQNIITEIAGTNNEKISLLGYSMGGRMALKILQDIPERIEKLILVAPDGLKFNFWHWLGTQTYIGNKIFKYTMLKNPILFTLVRYVGKLGFINHGVLKFSEQYLTDSLARKMLYKRWITMRKFTPDRKKIAGTIEHFNVSVRMLFGKNDQIIKATNGLALAAKNPQQVQVLQITAGHQLLKEKHLVSFRQMFFN